MEVVNGCRVEARRAQCNEDAQNSMKAEQRRKGAHAVRACMPVLAPGRALPTWWPRHTPSMGTEAQAGSVSRDQQTPDELMDDRGRQ